MPYIDGLPTTTTLVPTDLLVVCQGSTGAPGTGTDRSVQVSVFQGEVAGVQTFNSRAGVVALQASDVDDALGYSVSVAMQPVVEASTLPLGAQTLLASGSVLNLTGAPVSATFVGSGTPVNMWQSTHIDANLPTAPEITAQFAMNSNVGRANHSDAYKIGLAFSCLGGTNSADIYGGNSNVQGHGGSYLVTGYECDVNNIGIDQNGIGTSTSVYGIVSVAAGTAGSTAGLWVISTSGGSWWDGVAVSASTSSAYFDGATCPIGISIHGAHTTGIDMLAGYPISIAIAIPNNSPIQAEDSGGTLRNIVAIDGSNFLQFGDPGTIIRSNQSIVPSSDNIYQLGQSGLRWSSIWAANGTIQTSDPNLKTNIAVLPAMLPLVMSIQPKSFQWIVGGQELQDTQIQQEGDLIEVKEVTTNKVEVVNGMAIQRSVTEQREFPVYDEYPMVDSSGAPVYEHQTPAMRAEGAPRVQKTHKVHRRGTVTATVKKSTDVPGKRTHAGFLASDVKAAFEGAGVDYGAYVKAADGTEALRPDQLMALLWKAFQELAADYAAFKAAHS